MNAVKDAAAKIETRVQRALSAVGFAQSTDRIAVDAQAYWSASDGQHWKANSHWRDGLGAAWERVGQDHLAILNRGARAANVEPQGRFVDWGCGGGANAAALAPLADEIVGVDVSHATLAECAAQVTATRFDAVRIDVADPEAAIAEIEQADVFVCFYVFELIPTPEYGARLLRIAHQVLKPGGLALIQIKYDDGRFASRPRRRSYRRELASMTTYRIDAFWQLCTDVGFTPVTVELVPRNELDARYAYFTLLR